MTASTTPDPSHPRSVLLGAQAGAVVLPVCDHYSGVEARMRKSLALQASYLAEYERRVALAYPARADGRRLLAFPRMFIVARKAT